MTDDRLDIRHYKADGFLRVCDVRRTWDNKWWYVNICEELMFSPHRSWIYAIVNDWEIVKIGETGVPLGIRGQLDPNQPLTGTKSRLGRYRQGRETDDWIRQQLYTPVGLHQVSIWAKQCETSVVESCVGGQRYQAQVCAHKDLEIAYLDYIEQGAGRRPRLNTIRK